MSALFDDCGPAFPVADLSKTQCPGMTLRDWFAGQALLKAVEFGASPQTTALRCWAVADAMIAARKGQK